jgi:general secretion pathway protein F/type IV pilus assembly protein PilC
MGLYRYQGLLEKGKKIKGLIDADSELIAKERLRKDSILLVSLRPLEEKQREKNFPPSFLLSFTREVGQLLRAGLPLYESLETLEEKYRHQSVHGLFLDLCNALKRGLSFSAALKKYPRSFDEVYISMVKAAEQTGSLARIFDQLSLLIGKRQKLRKQLMSAAAYPAFLSVFCFIVTFVLLFFVIPSMKELFEGRELHPLTTTILFLSQFLQTYVLALGLGFLGLVSCGIILFRQKSVQTFFQKILLSLPILKTIFLQSALIRFCRSCSILLEGGVSLLESLRLSRKVMHNLPLEAVIESAERKIVEGASFSSELKHSPLIPSLMVRMLQLSEETGHMGVNLSNIAEIYEEELEKSLEQITAFLQPALLLLLGLIVGVVLLSVLLPLTDVSSLMDT